MLTCSDVLEAKQGTFGKRLSQVHGTVFLPTHSVIRGLPCLLKYGIIYACEVEAHMTSPGGLHLILAVFFVNHEEILGIAFNFTRDDVAPAPSITTSRSRTLRGCVDNNFCVGHFFGENLRRTPHGGEDNNGAAAQPLRRMVAPYEGAWIATKRLSPTPLISRTPQEV